MNGQNETPSEIAISEHELRAMTATLDEMHQESMSDVRESMAALTERVVGMTRTVANRGRSWSAAPRSSAPRPSRPVAAAAAAERPRREPHHCHHDADVRFQQLGLSVHR